MQIRQCTRYLAGIVFLSLCLAGCGSAPYTGRKQMLLISQSQENELGSKAYQQIKQDARLVRNNARLEMVKHVGGRIAAVADRPDFQWEYILVEDDKMVNATCLPGGKITVYTGILPYTRDENGLAVVLGHEVAHAIARHGGERVSQGILQQVGFAALTIGMKDQDRTLQRRVLAAYGLGSTVGIMLPFSRSHESEADHIGLILMTKAGYDPHQAVAFWKRIDKSAEGKAPPEFLSTHPSHKTRIDQIKKWIPEVLQKYGKGGKPSRPPDHQKKRKKKVGNKK